MPNEELSTAPAHQPALNQHPIETHSKHGITKPKVPYIGLTHTPSSVPRTTKEALQLETFHDRRIHCTSTEL